jgi:hypothetical protein
VKIIPIKTRQELKVFSNFKKEVYKSNSSQRSTGDTITQLLLKGSSAFHKHASVKPFLIQQRQKPVGRFALIQDEKLKDCVQVAFFEALQGLSNLSEAILQQARSAFPDSDRIVIGLDGHLNYNAGILLNYFDRPPVFGLPYTPDYYPEYFQEFEQKTMVSYRFAAAAFFRFMEEKGHKFDLGGITVRKMNKKKFKREIEIYTRLNNACFAGHPYWAERTPEEDYELFYPFRFLLKEEFLLFAEFQGKPIGFLLWYPDFNELVPANRQLGINHLLKFHIRNPIKTFRFTQIAVLPQYRISTATLALILKMIPPVKKAGYEYGEGGYIFEDNHKSIAMTRRFLQRATGRKMEPYRSYAIFAGKL